MRSSKRDYFCYRFLRLGLSGASAIAALVVFASRVEAQQQTPQASPAPAPAGQNQGPAAAPASQNHLPQIVVSAPKGKPKVQPATRPVAPRLPPVTAENPVVAAKHALDATMNSMDQARNNLLPSFGASTYTMTRASILDLPQADNQPIDKLILQIPGVSYDSAVSNPNFHIRGEYANAQIRINGVVLPEGVSGLGAYLATSFIGNMQFLTGTLRRAVSFILALRRSSFPSRSIR
jgi:hypothetical protein